MESRIEKLGVDSSCKDPPDAHICTFASALRNATRLERYAKREANETTSRTIRTIFLVWVYQ